MLALRNRSGFTGIFFKEGTTMEEATTWISDNIKYFNPNEAHTCKVFYKNPMDVDDGCLVVSGDEDYFELELVELKTVN